METPPCSTSAVCDCPELTFKFMSNAPVTESKDSTYVWILQNLLSLLCLYKAGYAHIHHNPHFAPSSLTVP